MNALDVMKVVGRNWQELNDEGRKYFQDKADKDKIRYLHEQEAFVGEIEKIGTEKAEALKEEIAAKVESGK